MVQASLEAKKECVFFFFFFVKEKKKIKINEVPHHVGLQMDSIINPFASSPSSCFSAIKPRAFFQAIFFELR